MMTSHLRFQRERRGWSRAALAEILGTTSATVTGWEEGFSTPSSPLREALCALFDLDDQTFERNLPSTNKAPDENLSFLLLSHTTPALPAPLAGDELDAVLDPFLFPPFKGLNRLVGRDSLFQHIKQQVLHQHNLALWGLPGVGKTALAIELAHDPEIRTQFNDGVLWAGLGLQPHVPGVLRRWGKLLGVAIHEEEPRDHQDVWSRALQAAVSGRNLLLILDDAWQVEVVEALRLGGANCGYVLTTRFAHIASHLVNEHAVQVPELHESDGLQLLTRFAPEILQHEEDTALTLVRAVGGHPLALTLMSKYLGSHAAMKQPRRLHTALAHLLDAQQRLRLHVPQSPLEAAPLSATEMELSIRSVISVSYLHLPELARQALLSLSVLPVKPARLTQKALLAVSNVPPETLDLLYNAGLLERHGDTHYMLHPLIADYLRAQGPEPEAAMRLVKYGIGFIKTYCSNAFALEQESTIILAALDCAWQSELWEELISGCRLFVPFLFRWGWYTLAEQLLQRASTAIDHDECPQNRICLLEQKSTLAHSQGNYAQAQQLAQQGLALARQQRDSEKVVALLTLLGESTHALGDYPQAESSYQEGLVLARQSGNQQQISILLKHLGVLSKKRGNYAQAQIHYQEGLALARHLDHGDLISLLLMNLGVIATERGDYLLAQTYYQEGLTLARQLGHRERICVLLSNLGVLADAQGNYAQAEELLHEGLKLARLLGHRERMSLLLLNLGVVANRQGKDKEAETFYQEGMILARQLEHRERISLFLLNLGDLAIEQGQDAQAQSYLQEGLALARQLAHRERTSDLLLHLSMLAIKQHKLALARTYLQEGLALAYQLDHPQLICRLLAAWGELHLRQQDIDTAEGAFLEMLDMVPDGGRAIVAQAQYGLASVAVSRGQLNKARKLAQRSHATFELLGHRKQHTVEAFLAQMTGAPQEA